MAKAGGAPQISRCDRRTTRSLYLTKDYQRKVSDVEIVGWIAVIIVALIVLAVLGMLLGSVSDITRYRWIRRM